jgi:hypothetical protein
MYYGPVLHKPGTVWAFLNRELGGFFDFDNGSRNAGLTVAERELADFALGQQGGAASHSGSREPSTSSLPSKMTE